MNFSGMRGSRSATKHNLTESHKCSGQCYLHGTVQWGTVISHFVLTVFMTECLLFFTGGVESNAGRVHTAI